MIRAAFLVRCSTNKQDYERQLDDLSRVCRRFGFTNTPDIIFGEHITGGKFRGFGPLATAKS